MDWVVGIHLFNPCGGFQKTMQRFVCYWMDILANISATTQHLNLQTPAYIDTNPNPGHTLSGSRNLNIFDSLSLIKSPCCAIVAI